MKQSKEIRYRRLEIKRLFNDYPYKFNEKKYYVLLNELIESHFDQAIKELEERKAATRCKLTDIPSRISADKIYDFSIQFLKDYKPKIK